MSNTWLSVERTNEGFPLFLRYPTGLNFDALRPKFPRLIVATHTFTHRRPNGLPEPDYNHYLKHMDLQLVRLFNVDQMGLPVLVETFGGERNYYFYVANDFDAEAAIVQVFQTFPHEKLSKSIRSDPDWSFIKKYTKEFSLWKWRVLCPHNPFSILPNKPRNHFPICYLCPSVVKIPPVFHL